MHAATQARPSIEPVPAGCVACATHLRPVHVPWHQHALGCPVRSADLQRRRLELHQVHRAPSIAAF